MMGWWMLVLGLVALPAWGGERAVLVGRDGTEVALRPAAGETLLLHFWASWCTNCAEDIDHLQGAAAACPDAPLRVIAVNVGERDGDVAEFVEKHGVRLPVLRDPKGRVWRETDGRGLPMNLFWTAEARRTDVGPKTSTEWRRQLASLGCEDPSDSAPEREPAGP